MPSKRPRQGRRTCDRWPYTPRPASLDEHSCAAHGRRSVCPNPLPHPAAGSTFGRAWREAWYAYGREVRAFCATHYLKTLGACLERELAKQGVSSAFFEALYKSRPQWTTLPTWCAVTDSRRCQGTTLQVGNLRTLLWEDFQRCEVIGQRCSTREEDCAGLVNWACCTR